MPEISIETVAGTITVSNPFEAPVVAVPVTPTVLSVDVAQGVKGDTGAAGVPGEQGSQGLSAYDLWLLAGNTGSLQDFFDYASDLASRLIDGTPVALGTLAEGDVLTYQSGNWTNAERTGITDGGNF